MTMVHHWFKNQPIYRISTDAINKSVINHQQPPWLFLMNMNARIYIIFYTLA